MSESSGEATPKESGPEVTRGANRYQLLVENSHDMLAEFTLDGTYVYANRAHEAILGYGVEELIGVNAFSLVHPDDQEKASRYIQEEQHRGTIRYRHKDGSWRWLDCTGSIYPIHGEPRMVISGRDITHQIQTQNRLGVLAGLARVLGAVNDFAEAARVVARAVGELCGWDAFSLDMYSAEENQVHPVLTIDTVNGHQMDVPHGYDGTEPSALFQRVLNEGPLLILRTEARFDGEGVPFGKEKRPSRSLLFVPLIEQGRTIGIASAQSYRANAYTEEDLKLFESLADHCAATFARLAAVEASREAQSWFQGFMEINPAAVSIKDQEGRFVYVNRTVEKATNTTLMDWVGKTDSEMLSADMARMFREQDQLILDKGAGRDFQVDLPMANGEVHRWLIWKFPLESKAGTRYLGAMALDIHEQEQAREALRQSEEKFRSVFHQAPVGISISLKGVFNYVNQAFLDLFGCKDEREVLGRSVVEFVAPAARAEMANRVKNREGGVIIPESYETTGLRSDGREFPLQVNVTRVRLPDGMNTVGFMMDLTQRRSLEAQLLHSQKLESVGRLAGGVAHDFNNLLTVVKGYASILEDSGLTRDQHEAVEQISTAAGKAATLTSQLLAFSRKQVVQLRPLDLNQVVQHMTRMLARVLGPDVALELDLDSCLPRVRADAGMLDQVILNLAVNARDAMPQGGTLRIVTRCADLTTDPEACREIGQPKAVCLEVSDTGCGISEEHLPKIFEPFFTTKEVGAGTGLGLPTVYGIVKQHGGAINVCSRVGEGARFRICIPSLELETGAEPCPAKPTEVAGGSGETILVVEDDTAIRNLVRLGLQRSGYGVIEAADATEGLARFKEAGGRISVVLTDIVMPGGISGKELAEEILALAPGTRIVFTSGYAPGSGKTGFALGPDQTFVAKPYKLQDLLNVIRKKIESGN